MALESDLQSLGAIISNNSFVKNIHCNSSNGYELEIESKDDFLKIKLNTTTDLLIMDMTGKAIHTEVQADSFVEINTAHWPEGVYLIQALKANSFETKRIVIQH